MLLFHSEGGLGFVCLECRLTVLLSMLGAGKVPFRLSAGRSLLDLDMAATGSDVDCLVGRTGQYQDGRVELLLLHPPRYQL